MGVQAAWDTPLGQLEFPLPISNGLDRELPLSGHLQTPLVTWWSVPPVIHLLGDQGLLLWLLAKQEPQQAGSPSLPAPQPHALSAPEDRSASPDSPPGVSIAVAQESKEAPEV